jgi:hypothetical protein
MNLEREEGYGCLGVGEPSVLQSRLQPVSYMDTSMNTFDEQFAKTSLKDRPESYSHAHSCCRRTARLAPEGYEIQVGEAPGDAEAYRTADGGVFTGRTGIQFCSHQVVQSGVLNDEPIFGGVAASTVSGALESVVSGCRN